MAGMNLVVLTGRVGKDPEIRTFQNGDRVATFSLATSETWRDKQSGERKEKTEWHNVKCLNDNLVKIIEQYVRKGGMVGVQGSLATRKWEKDGQDHYSTEVVIGRFKGSIDLMGSKAGNEGQARGGGGGGVHDVGADTVGGDYNDLDDEIPFITSASIW